MELMMTNSQLVIGHEITPKRAATTYVELSSLNNLL